MKISKIKLNNFGRYEDAQVSLGDEDLILVVGADIQNEKKSIGTGKSTLLESILFALYGKYKDGADSAICVRVGSKSACVSVEFITNGTKYNVIRKVNLKKNNKCIQGLEVFCNDKMLNTGVTDGQRLINDIVGVNYDLFVSISFFIQGASDKFISATPAKKLDYLSQLCNVTNFATARKNLSNDILRIEKEIHALEARCSANSDELSRFTKTRLDVSALIKEVLELEAKIVDLGKKNKEIQSNNLLWQEKSRIEASRGHIVKDLKSIVIERGEKKRKIDSIENDIKSAHSGSISSNGTSSDYLSMLDNISEIDRKIIQAKSFEIEIDNYKRRIEDLSSQGTSTCEYCGAELSKERVEKNLKDLENELNNKQFLKWGVGDLGELEEEKRNLLEQYNNIKRKCDKIEQERRFISTKEVEKSLLLEQLSSMLQREDALKSEFDSIERKMLEYSSIEYIDNLQSLDDVAKLIEKKNSIENIIQDQGRIAELEASISALQEKITEKKNRVHKLNCVKIGFSKHNIPKIITESALNSIEYYANEIIVELLDNYTIEFNTEQRLKSGETAQTLDIVIGDGKNKRNLLSFSGGEKALINFSLRLAISKFIVQSTSKPIGVVVLDEVFGSLGEYSTERVLKTLTMLKKEFSQIFNITHKTELEEIFTHKIEVIAGRDGISRIKGDDSNEERKG